MCWAKDEPPNAIRGTVSKDISALASNLQHPTLREGVAFETHTEREVGGVSLQPCLFVTIYKRSWVTCLASSDVTWIDLFPCRWQDADWRESAAVGPRLDQIRTAGCGVLCTAVTNIKQSGVPIRYEGAAWSRETGGGEWLKASLLHFSCVSTAPLTSGFVYILYCVCVSV